MPNWKQMLDIATSGAVRDDQLSPYIKLLSLPMIKSWGEKHIIIEWHATPESHQDSGMVFGGYISALADYAAGSAMLTILDERDIFFTKKLEIEYKRPIRSGRISIRAEIISQQDINATVAVSFFNEKHDLHAIAHIYQTIFSK